MGRHEFCEIDIVYISLARPSSNSGLAIDRGQADFFQMHFSLSY